MFGAIGQFTIGQASEAEEDTQAGALLNMLTAQELSQMRGSTELLMPDTCNILTKTSVPDGFGGNTETWGTASASVTCRLDIVQRTGSDEVVTGASLRSFQETILSVPYNTTITVDSRVEHDSKTYNVTTVNTSQSWIAVKRVTLEKT